MSSGFIEVARVGELQADEMKAFEAAGKRLLLVHAQGKYFAVDEMCTHEDYSLALGCIKGGRIKCSLHGSYFDLATGQPDDEPAELPIRSYAVKVEDDRIWVDPETSRQAG
jgi:3-phenylpropionate/trans-cinnamate dioxygenase ferredoxin subunit